MPEETLIYRIEIRVLPDELDPDTKDEILEAASDHDEDAGLRRYLGDFLNDAEDELNSALPEGFWVKIKEVRT